MSHCAWPLDAFVYVEEIPFVPNVLEVLKSRNGVRFFSNALMY
jgi:hypothetical protein